MADEEDPARARAAQRRARAEAIVETAAPEVGKETLVDAGDLSARDAGSRGPGKVTRVIVEEPKAPNAQAAAMKRTVASLRHGVDTLKSDVTAAIEAGKAAVAMLTRADPETLVEAVRELRDADGTPIVQRVMAMATSAIERALAAKDGSKPRETPPAKPNEPRAARDPISKPTPPIAHALRNHFSAPRPRSTPASKPSPKK